MIRRSPRQLERAHQIVVAQYLDWLGLVWLHVPNEGLRSERQGAMLKKLGMKPGVPDILILTPPPALPDKVGAAIELKPTKEESPHARLTPSQVDWSVQLIREGWAYAWCRGSGLALAQLRDWGYTRRTLSI